MKKLNYRILLSLLLCSGISLWWYRPNLSSWLRPGSGCYATQIAQLFRTSRNDVRHLDSQESDRRIIYRCEKCGTPTALNAPEGNLNQVDKTNNADNFQPVITSVTPDTFVPTIETARLRFRQMSNDDLEVLHAIYSRTEVAQSNTWQPYKTPADTQKMIDDTIADYRKGKKAAWIVEEKASNTVIGTARFVQWYPRDQRAVLGWTINSPYWGRGFGTECARMLIEYGAKYLNINRMQVIVRLDNAASRRVAIKAGMSHHARLRDHWFLKDEWLTFDQYAILRSDIAEKLGMEVATSPVTLASSRVQNNESTRSLDTGQVSMTDTGDTKTVSSHRCRICNPHKPLGCHDGGAGDAPDDNYRNYRSAVTKRFDGKYILCFETKRLRLRELTPKDLGRLHDILRDEETMARTSFMPHTSKSKTRDLLNKWRHGYTQGYTVPWGVEVKKTGELIGMGGYTHWYPDGHRCYIDYTMDSRYDEYGYQAELIRGLIHFGFTEMKFRRVEMLVRATDTVGVTAAANAGMSHEGTQHQYKKVGHQFVDFEMFGILKRQVSF